MGWRVSLLRHPVMGGDVLMFHNWFIEQKGLKDAPGAVVSLGRHCYFNGCDTSAEVTCCKSSPFVRHVIRAVEVTDTNTRLLQVLPNKEHEMTSRSLDR